MALSKSQMDTMRSLFQTVSQDDLNDIAEMYQLRRTWLNNQARKSFVVGESVQFKNSGRTMTGVIKKINPKTGSFMTFNIESARRLPGRSGINNVWSSNTLTKPAGSPRGLTSACPSPFVVPKHKNGDKEMKWRACLSRPPISLSTVIECASPMISRSAVSVAMVIAHVP